MVLLYMCRVYANWNALKKSWIFSEARLELYTHNLCSVFREIAERCKAREVGQSIVYVIKTKKIGQIEHSRKLQINDVIVNDVVVTR